MEIPSDLIDSTKEIAKKFIDSKGINVGYGFPPESNGKSEDDLAIIIYVRGTQEQEEAENLIGDYYNGWDVYYSVIGEIVAF